MEAEIIAVGTELLLGDILNTNAQFLSRELAALGITVHFQTVVGDNPARLESVVRQARGRSDLLVFSGGLGPTEDDLTNRPWPALSATRCALMKRSWRRSARFSRHGAARCLKTTKSRPWCPPMAARSPMPTALRRA